MGRRKAPMIPDAILDQLLDGLDAKDAFGRDGLLDALKKALAERALGAELDHHLSAGEADGRPNSRNGFGVKTVLTDTGKIELEIPRDRLASFDPKLIGKYQRRFPGFDDKVISMYARGMSTREIQGHLAELHGLDVSPDLISTVTDSVQGSPRSCGRFPCGRARERRSANHRRNTRRPRTLQGHGDDRGANGLGSRGALQFAQRRWQPKTGDAACLNIIGTVGLS